MIPFGIEIDTLDPLKHAPKIHVKLPRDTVGGRQDLAKFDGVTCSSRGVAPSHRTRFFNHAGHRRPTSPSAAKDIDMHPDFMISANPASCEDRPAFRSSPDRLSRCLIAAALCCAASAASAQAYPDKPIRVIVPYPPGGTTDFVVRLAQNRLQAQLGQPLLIENRAGATGAIEIGRAHV